MRRPLDALGDLLVSLAVVVWVVGGAYGAVQVLRYTYDLLGVWWVMFAVLTLPIAMAIMPIVALIHDNSWSLFLGTWDTLMLGWILQLAGGLIADRPRSGAAAVGEPPRDDSATEEPAVGRAPNGKPPSGDVTRPPGDTPVDTASGAPGSAPRASAGAASDEGTGD